MIRAVSACLPASKIRTRPGAAQGAKWFAASMALAACMSAPLSAHAALVAPAGIATCVACHGAQGEGSASLGAPRLAGQNEQYLAHALAMFKDGTRANPIMQPIAGGLSDEDIPQLAGYFAALHGPLAPAAAPQPAELVAAGKQLARVGAAGTAACFSCHGADGVGVGARFPSLVGQPAAFVVNRLHEFQARAKAKTPEPGTMTAVSTQLDETQIRQVAAYLSTLPPR